MSVFYEQINDDDDDVFVIFIFYLIVVNRTRFDLGVVLLI